MPSPRQTKTSTQKTSDRKLSDVAKHLVLPSGIVSTGYPAVAAQCRKMGVEHDDWQKSLGRAMLAKREGGLYAAGIGGILLSVCRQVGKTFTVGTIVFALCILFPKVKVLWTAHHSKTSDETFDALAGMARRKRIAPYIAHNGIRAGNGKQSIRFRNGSVIMFGAREHGFGRGIPGVSIVVFDEAQILTSRALNDMVPSVNTIRNPLIVYMGTPPNPGDRSEVFASRRKEALDVAKRRNGGESVVYDCLWVEMGADAGDDVTKPATAAKANPSYPKRTPPEAIARLIANLNDPGSISREAFGIWDEEDALVGPLAVAWPTLGVARADVPPDAVRGFGVAFSVDGMRVSLSGCATTDGRSHGELIGVYRGPVEESLAPLADWFAAEVDGAPRWRKASAIVLSGRSGASTLERLLLDRKVPRKKIIVATNAQYFQSCGLLLEQVNAAAQGVRDGTPATFTHLATPGQAELDSSAQGAIQEKRSRDGAWSWSVPGGDETPIESLGLAMFAAQVRASSGKVVFA